jgi:hypothetical protein
MPIDASVAPFRERMPAPSASREPAPWLPSGIRFVADEARASLIQEAARCRFVVVEVEPHTRGSLRDAIEDGVELVLARRGALPPSTEIGAAAARVVRDQHTRLRASAARGILIAMPSLEAYVQDGSLAVEDGAAVMGWLKLAQDDATPTVVVALSELDRIVPILVPRPIGAVVDEAETGSHRGASSRASIRTRVVPALAPTALPPPVELESALAMSALPSCVALLATTGAPSPVSTDAQPPSSLASAPASEPEPSIDVRAVLEIDVSVPLAIVPSEAPASAPAPVPAASTAPGQTAADIALEDEPWHAGEVIAARATPAPPVDLGVLEPPADDEIGSLLPPLPAPVAPPQPAPLAAPLPAPSPAAESPRQRAGRIASSALHAAAPVDDDEDDALDVADSAAARPPAKPLRDLREVFEEALRVDAPAPRGETFAAHDPFDVDRAKRSEHAARRVANAAVHRNHAMELEAAKGPKPLAVVHDLFVKHYLPLHAAMAKGEIDGAVRAVVEEWRSSFAQSYLGAFASMKMTGKRPTMVLDAPEIATKLGRAAGAKNVRLLLVDAMSFDLGKRVTSRMQKTLGSRATLVEEQVLWSALPTTTPTQAFYLARGSNGLRDQDPPPSEPDVSRGRNVSSVRRERLGSREIHKLDLVEARLRSGGDGYEERMEAIAEETAQVVSRFAETLPTRTLLYVFGDHGFTMGAGTSGFLTGHGGQGGASPEEVLVGGFAWLVDSVH